MAINDNLYVAGMDVCNELEGYNGVLCIVVVVLKCRRIAYVFGRFPLNSNFRRTGKLLGNFIIIKRGDLSDVDLCVCVCVLLESELQKNSR